MNWNHLRKTTTPIVVADIQPLQMLTRYELESFKRNDNTNYGSR